MEDKSKIFGICCCLGILLIIGAMAFGGHDSRTNDYVDTVDTVDTDSLNDTDVNYTDNISNSSSDSYKSNNYLDVYNDSKTNEDTSNSNTGSYVGSVNSDKFHEPSCPSAKRIKDSNKITFSSREDALNSGYEPCKKCSP